MLFFARFVWDVWLCDCGYTLQYYDGLYLGYGQVDNKHLALVVNLLNFRPAEMVRFFGSLESEDATVIYP